MGVWYVWLIMDYWQSCGSSKINADLNSVGDSDWRDILHLSCGALEIDVSLEDGHLPVVPGLGSLTAGGSSAADAEVLIGESNWAWDLDSLGLGIANQLVGDLLDSVKFVAAEGDSRSLELGVLNSLFLCVLVSHSLVNINKYYMINLIK